MSLTSKTSPDEHPKKLKPEAGLDCRIVSFCVRAGKGLSYTRDLEVSGLNPNKSHTLYRLSYPGFLHHLDAYLLGSNKTYNLFLDG